ncbi:MAG: DUF481 domain-containing protein [Desulfosudaceae bacterium]
MRNGILIMALITGLMLTAGTAAGDMLRLKNGDMLTGMITSASGGVVRFDANMAGQIRVAVADIACLESDREFTVTRGDKGRFTGVIQCLEAGRIRVVPPDAGEEDGGAAEVLEISNISTIQPAAVPEERGLTHQGSLTAASSKTQDTISSRSLHFSGRLESRYARHRLGLEARHNYAKTEEEVSDKDYLAGAKYDYFVYKRLFTYLQGLYERDEVTGLDYRITSSGGLGYDLIVTPRHQLSVEAGISHVNEHNAAAANRDYEAVRWALRLDSVLIVDKLKFFHYHEGHDRLDDSRTFIFRSEQGLRLKVAGNLHTNLEVHYDYHNDPPPEGRRSTTRYIFGLSYDFSL